MINEISIILKISLCAVLMFMLGKERQKNQRFIGPRTLILLGCASTLLTSISSTLNNFYFLGGVMTGIGFLGGGIINKENGRVSGLTTATLIWVAATIGITIGMEMYATAIFTAIFSLIVLRSKELFKKDFIRIKRK